VQRGSERLLEELGNVNGPLGSGARGRLRRALLSPSVEAWNQTYSIYVTPRYTLWQLIKMIDPQCPAVVPFYSDAVRKWDGYFPDTFTLRRALIVATGQDTNASSHG
jgi:hypothetical protein